ncbi:MAG: efflux RND transporter periplasmic adaptor subunit [Candidatus Riflebacteria bacterium]|nr:efflux RND transporter periplasmic adaptor subunit [Candidatus Riflebacteria bacterium]
MWIVRLALSRPYTFVVMALLIAILGGLSIAQMPTDIFPVIDIPIVSVVWSYGGISPMEMAQRVATVAERAMTTTVNDIEHMESQSLYGASVIRLFFQPSVRIELAVAQITSISQTIPRVMPPGIFPPSVIKYNASSVPILQLALSSSALTEQELYDYGQNFIRTQLAMVQGASVPLPYGGRNRQIVVDLDPQALYAKNLSPADVSAALNLQNLILPAGNAKIGDREYSVRLNSSPALIDALNDLPVRQVKGSTIYVRDVAQVHDGFAVQTCMVRHEGRRSALLTVLKSGNASTLSIIEKVKAMLKRIQTTLPPELKITQLLDQGVFVRTAIEGVVREAIIAAVLTGLMILLFLGSWRSTLIVCVSIPLSILCSCIVLGITGQTINSMTLGGLALAVGILVDDATVAIENIHLNLTAGKPLARAILDGAQQIAVPTFVSTLCICIVFVPVLFLEGVAPYLFTPLALSVVASMVASYILSRTLVPTMAHYLLPAEVATHGTGRSGPFWFVHRLFNRLFEWGRDRYAALLAWALGHRWLAGLAFSLFCLFSLALAAFVGQDFFPTVDAGQMRLHVRAPPGTRIEETEQIFARVERAIRRHIPASELKTILDVIGLPSGGINLAYGDTATIGPADGEILIELKPERTVPTATYVSRLRRELKAEFPDLIFYFQAASITNQILNFGLPAPIAVSVIGRDVQGNYRIARELESRIARVPGAADVHLHQQVDAPELFVTVDRTRAAQAGLTQRDVANSMLISLSSSGQVSPNFWLSPESGVNYQVIVQTPQHRIDSTDELLRTPIAAPGARAPQLLSNLATVQRGNAVSVVNHFNVQNTFDVYANVEGCDLGSVARQVYRIVADVEKKLPRGSSILVRGQVQTMNASFIGLGFGLVFAILLVYLLMVVNFQSWSDPFIILMALPGAIAGIVWALFVTQTTFSVPSLMGSIMCIGVATANSILIVTFANEKRREGLDSRQAALTSGFTRLRPPDRKANPGHEAFEPGRSAVSTWVVVVVGLLLAGVFGTLFAFGYVRQQEQRQRIQGEARDAAKALLRVRVVQVRRAQATSELSLPGNVEPITEATLFARADGYLVRRHVDIGDRVVADQLLAEIDSPELNQQVQLARSNQAQSRAALDQIKASLARAEANARLARVTARRYAAMVARGGISQQEGDQKEAEYEVRLADQRADQANVAAAECKVGAATAELQRLMELQAYLKVKAPFAGVITSRSVDVGSLIAAGNASGRELFRIAQSETLRITIDVPQSSAAAVRAGLAAQVTVQELPRRTFAGRVARTAMSLNQSTRTLLAEVQVRNPDSVLLPGMYAQVKLTLPRTEPPILIPGDTLLLRPDGLQVALVQAGNRVHFQPIDVGRDHGSVVEVVRGLEGGELLIDNPTDNVREGILVEPVFRRRQEPGGQSGPPPSPGPVGASGAPPGSPVPGGQAR